MAKSRLRYHSAKVNRYSEVLEDVLKHLLHHLVHRYASLKRHNVSKSDSTPYFIQVHKKHFFFKFYAEVAQAYRRK